MSALEELIFAQVYIVKLIVAGKLKYAAALKSLPLLFSLNNS